MTILTIGALLLALMLIGVPVSFSMLISGAVGIYLAGGIMPVVGVLKSAPYDHVASYTLSTLPMFILMAEFMAACGMTKDMFAAADKWLGRFKGGLAYAAVAGGVFLAAVCGSSSAAAATLTSAAYPEMRRYGYSKAFSTGAIAAVGTLAIMIPPSIALVLYGILTETSVGQLLLAGFVPGIATAIAYAIVIQLVVRLDPATVVQVGPKTTMKEKLVGTLPAAPIILLLVLMIVLIYSGVVTPTEVGALGALVALLIAFATRRMTWATFKEAVGRSSRNSAMILCIVAFAAVFGVFLSLTGAPQKLISVLELLDVDRYVVLVIVMGILIFLGLFMDQVAILIISLPLIFPLLTGLGFNAIWLGVLIVKTAEIGLLTPPVGLNLFIVSSTAQVPIHTVARGTLPYIVAELVVLGVLIAFPELVLWLPQHAMESGGIR